MPVGAISSLVIIFVVQPMRLEVGHAATGLEFVPPPKKKTLYFRLWSDTLQNVKEKKKIRNSKAQSIMYL
jgi:hypothetical protein